MSTRGARDLKWLGRTGRGIWTEKHKSEKLGWDFQVPRVTGRPAGTHKCSACPLLHSQTSHEVGEKLHWAEHGERTSRSTGTGSRT